MSLLAVDPGIRGCGCALFDENGRLMEADYVRNPVRSGCRAHEARSMACAVWATYHHRAKIRELALEWPQIYARVKSKGDPNDLLALCGVDTAIAQAFETAAAHSFLPAEWKGQLPKAACHARVRAALAPAEREALAAAEYEAGSLAHNVLDAVGIGLCAVGRFKRAR